MDFKISLELGPVYEVTYLDGSKIRFQVVGGPNVEARILGRVEDGTITIPSILQNFKSVVRIDE